MESSFINFYKKHGRNTLLALGLLNRDKNTKITDLYTEDMKLWLYDIFEDVIHKVLQASEAISKAYPHANFIVVNNSMYRLLMKKNIDSDFKNVDKMTMIGSLAGISVYVDKDIDDSVLIGYYNKNFDNKPLDERQFVAFKLRTDERLRC